jgi:hypothetical protein
MSIKLWEVKKSLVSPAGYDKIYHETGLYYSDEPEQASGKHWFIQSINSPCSKQWITDYESQVFIAEAMVNEIIEEEKLEGKH